MPESLYVLALLACPVGMGAMMWMMMRGESKPSASEGTRQQSQLVDLQAQVDQLQAEKRDLHS